MPRKPKPATDHENWTPVEREFLEALERLLAGRPKDPGLAKKAKADRLRVSVSAVATEAGRSRTLIGHDDCKYPRVRQRVLAAMTPVVEPRTAQDVIKKLRDDNADLRAKLSRSRSVNAALVMRMVALEKAAKRAIREAKREAESSQRPSLQVAGRSLEGGKVVPLRKPSTEEPSDD